MSGYGGADLLERAAAAGVSEVLRKPLQKRELAEALAKVMNARPHPRPVRSVPAS
jgi:CheY-like chemotaxis protein